MTISRLFIFMVFLGLFASCGEDCEATNLNEIIIGEWKVDLNGEDAEVEFITGNGLSDPDDILISGEIGPIVLDQKSFSVSGNTINVTASRDTQSIDGFIMVDMFDCERIEGTYNSFPIIMEKK